MAPTKSPNAILSETTTINSFVEQMIVLFDYWWSRDLVMIFYHACLVLPLTAGSSPATGKQVNSYHLFAKDFFTFKPDESDHSTCHSCKCFWLVFYGNFFFCVCAVNIPYTPDRAQYSLHMGYCI